MKIIINSKRQLERAVTLFIVVVLLVIFLLVIAGIAYMMIKALNKIFAPKKDDPDGQTTPFGSSYGGGVVVGHLWLPDNWPTDDLPTNPPPLPDGFQIQTVTIYAADTPNPAGGFTNQPPLYKDVPFTEWSQVFGPDGVPLEDFSDPVKFPNGKPAARFYLTTAVATPPATNAIASPR